VVVVVVVVLVVVHASPHHRAGQGTSASAPLPPLPLVSPSFLALHKTGVWVLGVCGGARVFLPLVQVV
jgi:hypothetical protein